MGNKLAHTLVRYIRGLVSARPVKDATDGQLLERFVGRHEEAAFAALVQRYGRLVLSVCRQVLRHEHDAEDAFQATFLVLAKKAGSIRKGEAIGSWLYGVALRIARKAKMSIDSRRRTEARSSDRLKPPGLGAQPVSEAALAELQRHLAEAVDQLPAKYRRPFILCCLAGKSREDVARELGWKKGTVSSRVAKARALLGERLARRGVALPAALCAGVLAQDAAAAALTPALAAATVRGALLFLAGRPAGAVSSRALGWAEAALRPLMAAKLKAGAALLLLLGILAAGAGLAARPARPAAAVPAPAARTEGPAVRPVRADGHGDPLPPGALVRLGELRWRPGARISRVAFSPDGTRLASWGNFLYHHDRLSLWDTATGKELRTELLAENWLAEFAWCADGRGFAVLGPSQAAADFLVWEFTDPRAKNPARARPGPLAAGREVAVGQAPEHYGPFAITADGRRLAAYHAGGAHKPEAVLFELAPAPTARRLKAVRTIKDLPAGVGALAFSRDGRALFAFSHADPRAPVETLAVYDTRTGRRQKTLTIPMALHQGGRKTFALSPDGSLLALGLTDGTLRLIDLTTGRPVRSLARHVTKGRADPWNGVSTVAFSPDGRRLITGGRDNALKVWDVGTGREVFDLRGHHSWPEATAFSADGKRIASAGQDSLIRLWDAATGRDLRPPRGHSHTVWGLAVSRDGRRALTNGWDGTARLWDLRTGSQVWQVSHDSGDSPAVLLDGRTVLTRWQGRWRLWDGMTGKEKPPPGDLARGRGNALGLSPDGGTLLSAEDGTVTLWSWPGGQRLRQIRAEGKVHRALLTPDGRTVLTWASGGPVALWDRHTGRNQGTLPVRVGMYPDLAALTTDGLLVVAGKQEPAGKERIVVCDVRARKVVREFPVEAGGRVFYLMAVAVSGDGRTVAVGQNDGRAVLYEVASGQVRRVLRGHREAVSTLAFTPDGKLGTTSLDHTGLVWDVTLKAGGPAPPVPLAEAERAKLWNALGDPRAQPAFAALAQLAADPPAAVALVRRHLPPARGIDDAALDRLVQALQDKRYQVRRRAYRELDGHGEMIVAGIKRRLAQAQDLELRARLQAFLKKHDRAEATPERLREIRAVQLLEELATPEALALLGELARGNANAGRTLEAARALERCRPAKR